MKFQTYLYFGYQTFDLVFFLHLAQIVNFPKDKLNNLINVSESQRKESNLSFEVKLFIKDIDV